jgi:DNA-binding transcriptional LysR family regulator
MNEIDLRLMRASVAVAEELNFSRAAIRLHISQPALTKQIQDLEGFLNTRLFERDHQKVTVTDAGLAFVAEARIALVHHQRAIQAARSAANGAETILNIGQSSFTDPFLTSIVASVHLPLHPNLRIHTFSDYSPELTRRVAAGELDLAIVAAEEESNQLSSVELSESPLYILLERTSELASHKELVIQNLKNMPWILFAHQVHPVLYELILECATKTGIDPPERHHVTSAEHAAQLVKATGGAGFLTKHDAWRVAVDGLTIRPLEEPGVKVRTVLTARNDSGRLVGEFVRGVVRKIKDISAPTQRHLPLTG